MGSSTEDIVYSCVGFVGGLLLALSTLPQLFFVVGIAMFLIYYAYYSLWPVFVSSSLSITFMFYLIGLKMYLERIASKNARTVPDGQGPQDYRPGSALLPADQLVGQQVRLEEGAAAGMERSDGS